LSKESVLLSKAIELGNTLYAAFDTPNRLPVASLSYSNARKGKQQGLVSMLSAVGGSLCMEFTRLSQLTGDHKYYDATERVKELLYREQNHTEVPGLWPRVLNFRDGVVEQSMFTLGAGADSLYEYLPKMYALLGGLDSEYHEMAVQALEAARDNLLFRPMTPSEDDILLAGNVLSYRQDVSHAYEMQHLTCFSGGMYALAGKLLSRPDFVEIGSRLTAGCVWAYNSFPTKMMPEISELVPCESLTGPCPYPHQAFPRNTPNLGLPDGFVRVRDTRYALRPEAIESIFYMWRITGDELWRDAAWRMWENIVRETETDVAFATVTDVTTIGGPKSDNMEVSGPGITSDRGRVVCVISRSANVVLFAQTFWLAETLKYFYLIFDDESTLDLDDWVFNTEAHPFKRPKQRFRS
jgi:mannosyl-oligosaccharide alpha-1,2-mannosidase